MRSVRISSQIEQVLCLTTILVACAQSGPVAVTGMGATETSGGTGGQSDSGLGGTKSADGGSSDGKTAQGGTKSDPASGGANSSVGGVTGKATNTAATSGSKATSSATGGKASGGASTQSGGAVGSGGDVATGGKSSSTTKSNTQSLGGAQSTGGTRATGGVIGQGGAIGTGGAPESGGSNAGTVAGSFPCNAANSTAVVTETMFAASNDSCFSWTKPASGVLKIGNWSGVSITAEVADSAGGVSVSTPVPSGGWTDVAGVAAGAVYIHVLSVASGGSVQIKVNAY